MAPLNSGLFSDLMLLYYNYIVYIIIILYIFGSYYKFLSRKKAITHLMVCGSICSGNWKDKKMKMQSWWTLRKTGWFHSAPLNLPPFQSTFTSLSVNTARALQGLQGPGGRTYWKVDFGELLTLKLLSPVGAASFHRSPQNQPGVNILFNVPRVILYLNIYIVYLNILLNKYLIVYI